MPAGPVVLAADHGGFPLKETLKRWLAGRGYDVLDVGTHSKASCDYPVFATAAAQAVASGRAWRGVVIDGAGIGSSMVANKVPGVRAAMAFDEATANNAREHNDANLLTLGAGYLSPEQAQRLVEIFLTTECTVDRHRRRVAMIDALDRDRPEPPEGAAAAELVTGSTPPMSAPSDYEQLVDRITQVLQSNPGLLGGVAASRAPAPPASAAGTVRGAGADPCAACAVHGHCASQCSDEVRTLAGASHGGRITSSLGVGPVPKDIAKLIDHTLLKPDATYAQIDQLCDEAAEYGFASVCVNPLYVRRCAGRLRGAEALVCTVIGFPLGATPKEIKAMEARRALRDGAKELDMVIPIGALKSGDHQAVLEDIRLLAEVAHAGRAKLKVIIETALLTDEEKVAACVLAKRARADYVKTSTGFASGGATAHDVELMARAVEYKLGVKASGGVRSAADAEKMIAAGATRIGASVGVKIAQEARGA